MVCVNASSLDDARHKIEAGHLDHNHRRPQGSLGTWTLVLTPTLGHYTTRFGASTVSALTFFRAYDETLGPWPYPERPGVGYQLSRSPRVLNTATRAARHRVPSQA